MAELKTKLNDANVEDFINAVSDATRRKDGFELLTLFTKTTGEKAKMWGSSIVGFGQYYYESERSSQKGEWPLVSFSPRKQNLTLYVIGFCHLDDLLAKLGKHKTSVGCLYINKLSDIDLYVLEKIIDRAYQGAKKQLVSYSLTRLPN